MLTLVTMNCDHDVIIILEGEEEPERPEGHGIGRWMSGREALLAQAFPVHFVLHQGACSFNVPSSKRWSRVMRQQAGNSMNLFALTVQYLYMMLYTKVSVETKQLIPPSSFPLISLTSVLLVGPVGV